jgi:hypothetical protein
MPSSKQTAKAKLQTELGIGDLSLFGFWLLELGFSLR